MAGITGRLLALASLLCACACAAVPAATAAQAPEFGRCVKHAGGSYGNAGCTLEASSGGSYEWEPGPGPRRSFTIAAKGTTGLFIKLATNNEGKCSGVSGSGEYTGAKTVGDVRIVFTGCHYLGLSCEAITLAPVKGELGVYALGTTAAGNKLGIELSPESGTSLAEFNCENGLNPYLWRGGFVIGAVASNTMQLTGSLTFRQHKTPGRYGETEIPANFIGQSPSPLESTDNGSNGGERTFDPMGWSLSTAVHNEERIEANSVL